MSQRRNAPEVTETSSPPPPVPARSAEPSAYAPPAVGQAATRGPVPANAIDDAAILDAVYELLLTLGPRRMTMADIARGAQVSRATLYRRWRNVGEAIATVLTREWDRLAADAEFGRMASDALAGDEPGDDARTRIVDAVVAIARTSRTHPLVRTIVDQDPEFLLPYLLRRRGRTVDHQLAAIEEGLRIGIADGSVRDADVAALARTVVLSAWSSVLTGPVLTDDLASLDDELRHLLDQHLRPNPR
ncbi:TetR/AcrR family transcriptional regulator [Gordonia soli]|uniref:Putative TetR family transcriptional regulator n=1 Tax=Gordonia soli NBRC 108243 TaxID=1223545 RepID=M0QG37_9ACTN|nr:TetR/AcrR family transcriptional regulator [Gordonia soli]GAC67548.1 putative TetR family transcriptional regulator [Gordonia soli NBRC 108243]